jgi:hypothetical protein
MVPVTFMYASESRCGTGSFYAENDLKILKPDDDGFSTFYPLLKPLSAHILAAHDCYVVSERKLQLAV